MTCNQTSAARCLLCIPVRQHLQGPSALHMGITASEIRVHQTFQQPLLTLSMLAAGWMMMTIGIRECRGRVHIAVMLPMTLCCTFSPARHQMPLAACPPHCPGHSPPCHFLCLMYPMEKRCLTSIPRSAALSFGFLAAMSQICLPI